LPSCLGQSTDETPNEWSGGDERDHGPRLGGDENRGGRGHS
jgi:hypothetical protein